MWCDFEVGREKEKMSDAVGAQAYSTSTLENALRAKVTMENFYDNLLVQDRDRINRWTKLEMSMEDMGLSNEEVRGYSPTRV